MLWLSCDHVIVLPGVPEYACDDATNIGLWVDAFNFAVISLQIIVMDTSYTDTIRDDLIMRGANAAR